MKRSFDKITRIIYRPKLFFNILNFKLKDRKIRKSVSLFKRVSREFHGRIINFHKYKFLVSKNVLVPHSLMSSFFVKVVSDRLAGRKFDYGLDMGCGSGVLTFELAAYSRRVLGVDINQFAVANARKNAQLNKINNVEFRQSDLFTNIKRKEKFDLIICNPPFFQGDVKEALDRSFFTTESEFVDFFLKEAKLHLTENGLILLCWTSLADKKFIEQKWLDFGYKSQLIYRVKTTAEQLLFYEASVYEMS